MRNETVDEYIKRKTREWYRETHIFCPYCEEEKNNDDCQYPVTYAGDDGDYTEFSCESCEKEFYVHELVERKYETFKKEDSHESEKS